MEEMKDCKEDIDIKDEPPGFDLNPSLESEGANVIRVLKSELKYDVDIKCEPLDCAHNKTDSLSAIGFHSAVASEKFIKREIEEDKEEEKIDIKYESLDCELKRPAIENANEHAEKQFECHKCSYKSKYKQVLNRHFLSKHAEKRKQKMPGHACQLCSYKTFRAANLKRHIRSQHEENKCHICSYKSKYKYALNRHFLSKHAENECHICSYKSRDNFNLRKHILLYHWDQSDSFKHLLTNKVSQCPKCSYIFGNTTSFKRHLLTHEKDQSKFKFECYTCGYKCVKKSTLIRHVRIHTDQLPFACIECTKVFNSKRSLNGHIVSRHKENEELMKTVTCKIHQCLKCSYKTVLSANLKQHIQYCDNK